MGKVNLKDHDVRKNMGEKYLQTWSERAEASQVAFLCVHFCIWTKRIHWR